MSVQGSTAEWREEARALERFALAVTPDARLACARPTARRLTDGLINRAVLAFRNGEGPAALSARSRLLCLFVRFHRRYIRLRDLEEEGGESGGMHDGTPLERAIARLPLEWREALLLVVLERFSHAEAAAVLEIPLSALVDRLGRARAALSDALAVTLKAQPGQPRRAHLTVVK